MIFFNKKLRKKYKKKTIFVLLKKYNESLGNTGFGGWKITKFLSKKNAVFLSKIKSKNDKNWLKKIKKFF